MSGLEALLMGILQGLTEFLPVSSSAHLKLTKLFLGLEDRESLVIFDLVCHLGTTCALLLFLRDDLLNLLRAERKKIWLILIALLPLFPFYFLLKPLRDWASQTPLLGYFLIVTGLILFVGQKFRIRRVQTETFGEKVKDALWIGTLQATALIPGISRSASTISCAQVLGWEAKEAVRFSFLLSIPTIMAGNSAELLKLTLRSEHLPISFSSCILAFLASLSVGFFVIRYAVRFLEKGNLKPFAWYCLILGILTTLYFAV